MEELALRYAQALFLLSKEKNQVLEYQEEIKTLREILEDNEEFISLINDGSSSLAFSIVMSLYSDNEAVILSCAIPFARSTIGFS